MVMWIHVILGTVVGHDPQMCPIVFDNDVMHINEWAGLKVKILKCKYFNNCLSILLHIGHDNVVK